VGALPEEVSVMNTFDGKIHLLMVSFTDLPKLDSKFYVRKTLFLVTKYMFQVQGCDFHGLDRQMKTIVEIKKRHGEHHWRPKIFLKK